MVAARRVAALALALGGCNLYIDPNGDDDRDGPTVRPPADALQLDGATDADLTDGAQPSGPSAPTHATQDLGNGTWADAGLADWTCLGVVRDQVALGSFQLSGAAFDPISAAPLGAHALSVTPSGSGNNLAFGTTDDDGTFSLAVPRSVLGARYDLVLGGADATHPFAIDLDVYFDPALTHTHDLRVLPRSALMNYTFPIGAPYDRTKAIVLGQVRDCQGRPVTSAVVVVSNNSTALQQSGVLTYYFNALPNSEPFANGVATNFDGRFAAFFLLPDTQVFFQAWGYRTPEDLAAGFLTRLATLPVRLPADTVGTVVLEARQTPL